MSERSPSPGDGYVSNLQSADRGELIGYTFSDADLGAAGGTESALFTASLKETEADVDPTPVAVMGADARVAEWRFVPDTDSILLLSFDGSLLLTGATGDGATALGSALSIEGIARGSSEAIVARFDGMRVIDLSDAAETDLVAADAGSRPARRDHARPGRRHRARRRADRRVRHPRGHDRRSGGRRRCHRRADGTVLDGCRACTPASRRAGGTRRSRWRRMRSPTRTTGTGCRCRERLESHIVEIATGEEVVALSGFDVSWCQVPPG